MGQHYKYHIFFCLNEKDAGKRCCRRNGAEALWSHTRLRVSQLKQAGLGQVRVNRAGCLGHCSYGPAVVVYPEGVWYRCQTIEEMDKIIDKHLLQGEIVTECVMPEAEVIIKEKQ